MTVTRVEARGEDQDQDGRRPHRAVGVRQQAAGQPGGRQDGRGQPRLGADAVAAHLAAQVLQPPAALRRVDGRGEHQARRGPMSPYISLYLPISP